jgi:hypothetical protein
MKNNFMNTPHKVNCVKLTQVSVVLVSGILASLLSFIGHPEPMETV